MKKIIIFLLVLFNFSFGKAYEPFDKEKAITNNMQLDKDRAEKDLLGHLNFFEKFETLDLKNKLSEQEKNYFDLSEARLFVIAHNFDEAKKLLEIIKVAKIKTNETE